MGPECNAVSATCRALAPRVALTVADAVGAIGTRVVDTPSLVVTGPVSSGKSTLVNALVGRRVAPTGAGECTRLVAHYRRGPADRLDVVLTDGTRRPLPLAPGGRVPAAVGDRLGVDPDDVDHLVVTLTSAALDGLTVVDTPGTGTARRPRSSTADPAPDAAAALVVLPATAHAGDLDALPAAAAHGPAGVVAVLGRADTVDGPDAVAAQLGPRLDGRAGPVLPVIGLLAETAVTGALRSDDLIALRELARSDAATLADALADPELFTTGALPVPTSARAQLVELLDVRGVDLAVALLRRRPDAGLGEVCDALLAASGLGRLVARLTDEIRIRTDVLAAAAGIRCLEALAGPLLEPVTDPARHPGRDPGDGARVRDAAAALRRRAGFAEHALLGARARVHARSPALPVELVEELDRLTGRGPPATRLGREGAPAVELAGYAARRAAWWRSYASWGTSRPVADVAHVVHRAYVGLWRELTR